MKNNNLILNLFVLGIIGAILLTINYFILFAFALGGDGFTNKEVVYTLISCYIFWAAWIRAFIKKVTKRDYITNFDVIIILSWPVVIFYVFDLLVRSPLL